MKNPQQNLLIILATGLCGLCAFQWYSETLQRNQVQTLNEKGNQQSVAIRDYTNSIATMNHQISQMDARITEIKEAGRTNEQLVVLQKREISGLQFAGEGLTNQIAQYKSAVEMLQGKLKDAYDGINRQNESMKELVAQRDDFVKKYNDSVKERNDIVAKYNELVVKLEKSGGTNR